MLSPARTSIGSSTTSLTTTSTSFCDWLRVPRAHYQSFHYSLNDSEPDPQTGANPTDNPRSVSSCHRPHYDLVRINLDVHQRHGHGTKDRRRAVGRYLLSAPSATRHASCFFSISGSCRSIARSRFRTLTDHLLSPSSRALQRTVLALCPLALQILGSCSHKGP